LTRSTWNASRELRDELHDPEIADKALRLLLDDRPWEPRWCHGMKGDQAREHAATEGPGYVRCKRWITLALFLRMNGSEPV